MLGLLDKDANLSSGKKITVTLIGFGVWSRKNDQQHIHCGRYGTFIEHSSGEKTSICGGNQRTQVIYTSKTSTLDVTIEKQNQKHFLLKYESNSKVLDVHV